MPCFFSRYLNFCFYKDIGTRCSRTDDIASFFNHQRLADDIIKTKFLNRNTKLHAGAIPYICTTSSETIVPVFVISSTASSVAASCKRTCRLSYENFVLLHPQTLLGCQFCQVQVLSNSGSSVSLPASSLPAASRDVLL